MMLFNKVERTVCVVAELELICAFLVACFDFIMLMRECGFQTTKSVVYVSLLCKMSDGLFYS